MFGLKVYGFVVTVNASFTWDKCHDVCSAEAALTRTTMRCNDGNTDKWMTQAFESERIIILQ